MSARSRALIFLAVLTTGCGGDQRRTVNLGIPTTIQDSGLLDALLPEFERAHPELRLRYVAAGSGELLALGTRGDLDVLLAHSPVAERQFMEAGRGAERSMVMENDFVIAGPGSDPAGVRGMRDAVAALARIAGAGALFLSRADDSGTHRKELELREISGLAVGGPGHREMGQGMGAVLRAASDQGAYTLCDRATLTNLAATLELEALVEGDPRLVNVYSVILIADPRELEGAREFIDWLTSGEGRDVISSYGVEQFGAPLFRSVDGSRPHSLPN